MKNIYILAFLISSIGNSVAQQITFQKVYGTFGSDMANLVRQTTDGGYIIVGVRNSSGPSNEDIYLIKTDSIGDTLWTKTFGGGGDDFGNFVEQTSDGGYIVTGYTNYSGYSDVYLIKTDANGNALWSKSIGGAGVSYNFGTSVQQTLDGGYIITGHTNSFSAGPYDVYLIKTNANGDTSWTKTIGGTGSETGLSVMQTTDGGYIIIGYSDNFSGTLNDIYLVKTDSDGNVLWAKTFGGTGNEYGLAVQQTNDGGYMIAGWTNSFGNGNENVYLIKTNASGDTLWSKAYNAGVNDSRGYSFRQTNDGGYIITGYTDSFIGNEDIYLIKTDVNGDTLWTRTFGGTSYNYGNSVMQTADGGYIIAGVSGAFGAGLFDFYLIKTDANGNSGCNQGNTATIVFTPATQVTSPATIVSSGGIITNLTAIVGSGGTVTTLCTTVGISSYSNFNFPITLSPNPATNNFTITFPHIINKGAIEIYNVLGEKVMEEVVFNVSAKEIFLSVNPGIYFLEIIADGERSVRKIVKQ
ncbi:MAG: T9SS type A sorting domain-containing protein [Bacteroidia bacterium]